MSWTWTMRLPDLFGIRRRRAELYRLRRIAATRISLLVEEWGPVTTGPFAGGQLVHTTLQLVNVDAEGAYLVGMFGGHGNGDPAAGFHLDTTRERTVRLVFTPGGGRG